MLTGQNLRWSHDRSLPTTFDALKQRGHRNHRLARAHLALKQTVHRVCHFQVGLDLGQDPGLCRREVVGQALEKLADKITRRLVGNTGCLDHLLALLNGKSQLESKQLVVHKSFAGRTHVFNCLGEVDDAEGLVPIYQPMRLDELRGNGVLDGSGAKQRIVDGPTHDPRTDLPHRSVDRHNAARDETLRRRVEDVDRRAFHLQCPSKRLDNSGKCDLGTLGQLTLPKRLVEPNRLDRRAFVGDSRLDDRQVTTGTTHGHRKDLPNDGHLGTDRDLGDWRLHGAIDVAAWHMMKQIGHTVDACLRQGLGPLAGQTLHFGGANLGKTTQRCHTRTVTIEWDLKGKVAIIPARSKRIDRSV